MDDRIGYTRAGRNYYGVDVGIVLVNTRFPRPVGDVGNARSFDFPVAYRVCEDMTQEAMRALDAPGVAAAAVDAVSSLVKQGVRAVATSCGLMAKYQAEMAGASAVPVLTSSLLQLELAFSLLPPDARIGVIASDANNLRHAGQLDALGLPAEKIDRLDIRELGPGTRFRAMLDGEDDYCDTDAIGAEVVELAREMVSQEPSIKAFVLECTNLCPYSGLIRDATGRPVWDAVTAIRWLASGYES